jgi:hypothetical protein
MAPIVADLFFGGLGSVRAGAPAPGDPAGDQDSNTLCGVDR